jgi:hypothetical protein
LTRQFVVPDSAGLLADASAYFAYRDVDAAPIARAFLAGHRTGSPMSENWSPTSAM